MKGEEEEQERGESLFHSTDLNSKSPEEMKIREKKTRKERERNKIKR
jgi:hypothetical protein